MDAFYHTNVFRFRSEQVRNLFENTEILGSLKRIEIDDDTMYRSEQPLDEVLEPLQQLPSLAEVLIGVIVSSDQDDTIFRLESTRFVAWET